MKNACALALLLCGPALADPPVIENVTATRSGDAWRFDVTISHPDTGWEHFADGWRVLSPSGTELGYRKLMHPHETEQPFTRSQGGIRIPHGVTQVLIEARDNVTGWTGTQIPFDLPR